MSGSTTRALRRGGAITALGLLTALGGAPAAAAAGPLMDPTAGPLVETAAGPLVDPAPAAAARGVPLERLPREGGPLAGGPAAEAAVPADRVVAERAGSRADTPAGRGTEVPTGGAEVPTGGAEVPVRGDQAAPGGAGGWAAAESLVWLTAAGGVLVALLLRQRSLAGRVEDEAEGGPSVLTGTPALVHALSTALVEARDSGEPVGLVVLRVESWPSPGTAASLPAPEGPGAVDAVLDALDSAVPLVARAVGRRRRAGDALVRLGVNRLAVVLPGSGGGETRTVAERLRAAVAADEPHLVVTVGHASAPADGPLPSMLLRAADAGLTSVTAAPAL